MKFIIDLKIFIFLILFYFTKQIEIYVLIMIFAIIHELTHLFIGIILRFKPDKLYLNSLGLSVSFRINPDEYNTKINKANSFELKKIIVAMVGPLINFIIAIIFYNFNLLPGIREKIVYVNLLIGIFNLIPIYPLDGGRILKGILHIIFGKWKAKKYINDISIVLVIFLTSIASVSIYYFKNLAFLIIVLYLWLIVLKENYKYKKELNIYNVIKSIENNKKK